MPTKSYEVFYLMDGVRMKTHRVYKGLGAARGDAKLITRNPAVSSIEIVGYDEMAHRSFQEVVL
jgi:hypothetical protein